MLICLILLQAPDLEEEWDQRHKKNIFSLNQCMFLTKQFFLNRILHRVNYLTLYKRWGGGGGRISFDVTLEASLKFSCCPSKRGFKDIESGTVKNAGPPRKE